MIVDLKATASLSKIAITITSDIISTCNMKQTFDQVLISRDFLNLIEKSLVITCAAIKNRR